MMQGTAGWLDISHGERGAAAAAMAAAAAARSEVDPIKGFPELSERIAAAMDMAIGDGIWLICAALNVGEVVMSGGGMVGVGGVMWEMSCGRGL
jgi:hypothetical protein